MWYDNLKVGDKVIIEYEFRNDYKMRVKEVTEIGENYITIPELKFIKKNNEFTRYVSGFDELSLGRLYKLREWTPHLDNFIKTREERERMVDFLNDFQFDLLSLTDLRNAYNLVQNREK